MGFEPKMSHNNQNITNIKTKTKTKTKINEGMESEANAVEAEMAGLTGLPGISLDKRKSASGKGSIRDSRESSGERPGPLSSKQERRSLVVQGVGSGSDGGKTRRSRSLIARNRSPMDGTDTPPPGISRRLQQLMKEKGKEKSTEVMNTEASQGSTNSMDSMDLGKPQRSQSLEMGRPATSGLYVGVGKARDELQKARRKRARADEKETQGGMGREGGESRNESPSHGTPQQEEYLQPENACCTPL